MGERLEGLKAWRSGAIGPWRLFKPSSLQAFF